MKNILFAVMLVSFLTVSLQAQGMPRTAGEFAKVCVDADARTVARDPVLALNRGFCIGYMQGVLITNLLVDRLKRGQAFYCPAVEVSPDQGRKIFLKYMNDHPEKLHEEPNFMVIESLVAAFPCKASATR